MAIKGGKWEISDAEFERQFAEATKLGKEELADGVFATAARYDKTKRRLVIDLANGMTVLIPLDLLQGLQEAKPKELADVEILGAGSGLYWPQLNLDIALSGLLAKILKINSRLPDTKQAETKVFPKAKQAAA
jgi:hypothetical protein